MQRFSSSTIAVSRVGAAVWLLLAAATSPTALARDPVKLDLSDVARDAEIHVTLAGDGQRITVDWPANAHGAQAQATFDLSGEKPLLAALDWVEHVGDKPRQLAHNLTPTTIVTVSTRDLSKPESWNIFFDKVHTRPRQRHAARLELIKVQAQAAGSRARVTFEGLSAGPFNGHFEFEFYAGLPLIHAVAVLSTTENNTAFIYDAGLVAAPGQITRYFWIDPQSRELSTQRVDASPAAAVATRFRTVAAETSGGGAIAVFPAPHQFLYPLDFAENFGFNWRGRDYADAPAGDGWGVRQTPDGDRRFTPWVNAPPGTQQRLGAFYLLDPGDAPAALAEVQRFTRSDHYTPLAGYRTFTSHYHIEHTLDLLKQQEAAGDASKIPDSLRTPGFTKTFRELGVEIVHLAEFHNGQTPKLETAERLRQLRTLHAECARLSDEKFLLLPGEEPNVHLGGHWLSFFPRPVLWVLNRPDGTPFVETNAAGETVYRVGSPADVLELMRREHGLMWTAHARTKSSTGYPDAYRSTEFFKSPQFFGAAWKAMPADYSRDKLGWRILDLLDDMNQRSPPKLALGEVDVFKVEPHYELYGHANVNYVRLDQLPRFADGWQPLLNSLRRGDFFVTTGEILASDFRIDPTTSTARARLAWTFPLSYAELIGHDGTRLIRQRIDLAHTRPFGTLDFSAPLPAPHLRWLRLEVWDIATNGAFTQPLQFGD